MTHPGTIVLMVGLPASGKTTAARELEAGRPALRLTPDEWMQPLFGDGEADGRRDVLEGRLISLGLRAAMLGLDVIWDFGCWTRYERAALHALATEAGAGFELRYLPVDPESQVARVAARRAAAPDREFHMSVEELERQRVLFDEPTEAELSGHADIDIPDGASSWSDWAARRWPGLSG